MSFVIVFGAILLWVILGLFGSHIATLRSIPHITWKEDYEFLCSMAVIFGPVNILCVLIVTEIL
jgi:hypothetical protein